LGDVQSWPEVQCDDEYSVVWWEATRDGLFTVKFLVGIDARQLQPIKRFVTAHAIKMLQDDPMLADAIRRPIRSVNAEGQSLTFETGSVADGAIGVAPKLESLKFYKRRVAYRAHAQYSPVVTLWPNRY